MRLFVWKELPLVTGNYHPEGGVIVIHNSLQEAKDLLETTVQEKLQDQIEEQEFYEEFKITEPDFTCAVSNKKKPVIFIFPNAGCC